jgi:hypothetical protein
MRVSQIHTEMLPNYSNGLLPASTMAFPVGAMKFVDILLVTNSELSFED